MPSPVLRAGPLVLWIAALGLFAAPLRADSYRAAAEAMATGDWDLAATLAEAEGPVARDLVTWTRLREGAGSFPDYVRFLQARPDWPGLDRLRSAAEATIPPDAEATEVRAFFGDRPPRTGEGALALARALVALGEDPAPMLTQAWLTLRISEPAQAGLLAEFGAVLAPLHVARTDAILWRWWTDEARRMLPLLPEGPRALARARIALIDDEAGWPDHVAAVPAEFAQDPGLACDLMNRRASDGDYTDAIALIAARSTSAEALGQPMRWASWRASLARWLMREGRGAEARDLARQHFLTEGEFFADLEWVAGHAALRAMDRADLAAAHFATARAAVAGPVSISRMAYWQGRAAEALGDPDTAARHYQEAATYQTAFYGLLAAERLGLPADPALAGTESFPPWTEAPFLSDDRAQALLLLLGTDQRSAAVQFALALQEGMDRATLGQFGQLLAERGEPFFEVLVAKAAAERGLILPATYFPLHPLAQMDLPVPPELALAIARRESEFNPVAGSPVGALGLMQVMPGTAEEVAGDLGLPYSRARLTADWEYNARLGTAYLAGLIEEFGFSPVLVAAGYNAGPGRPRDWITARGDPRWGEVDVVDWIEAIPFTETRTYVMRVAESIPVYRARLGLPSGGPQGFTDLLRGEVPQLRPRARPEAPMRPVARP